MSERGHIRGIGSYFSQIWHATGNDSVPFYPLWFNQFLNRKLPVILDMNNLMLVYASVPILRTVLDMRAQLLKQGKTRLFKVDKKTGENTDEVFSHPVLTLLKKPNCILSGNEFKAQWCLMFDLYQTALIYKNKITKGGLPRSLQVMPTGEFKINPTGYIFDQLNIEDVIESYEHINSQFPQAAPRYYKTFEIMRYVDGPSDRYFFGIPKIITNKILASNLQLALQTQNILLSDRGPMWLVSNDNKDMAGGVPLSESEQKSLNKSFSDNYGVNEDQSRFILSQASLKAQALGFPTKDLMTEEIKEASMCALCDVFGMQRGLFADTTVSKSKDSIGGDGKGKIEEAMKITIETTIEPLANTFLEGFNNDPDYGLIDAEGSQILRLVETYDHLPVMQEDQVDAENVKNVKAQAAATLTTSIMSLVSAVKSGQMDYDAALAMVINIHGVDESIAKEIFVEPTEITPPAQLEPEEGDTEEDKNFKRMLKSLKIST